MINLAANGTYTLTSVDNTTNGGNGLPVMGHDHLVFGTDLAIHGNGATVQRDPASGTPMFRIFEVVGGNIVLQDIVILNGIGVDKGGGVENSGSATVTMTSCTFSGNNAGTGGGGVSNSGTGTVTLTGCSLDHNTVSAFGAGILNESGTVNLNSSILTFNSTSDRGGAVYNTSGTVNITDSTLENNSADDFDGGAIFTQAGAVTINHSTLSANIALTRGGGICVNGGTLTMTDSRLSANSASQGAGAGIFVGSATITNCEFTGNSTRNAGAGIFNAATTTVDDSTFDSNDITTSVSSASADPTGPPCNGGAVSNSGSSATISLTNCAISNGVATILGAGSAYGIAAYNNGGTINLTDCTIEANTAVVGHDENGNYGTIVFEGGAVFNNATGEVNLARCTLSTNVLPTDAAFLGQGAGVFNNGSGTINISNSTVAFNTARFGGGILNNANGAINLFDSTVAYNAAGAGGGIYNVTGPFAVKSTIVAVNTGTGSDADVSGNFISDGFNLIGVDQNNGFSLATDKRGSAGAPLPPQLGSFLANNGGLTKTIALLSSSPAINSGDGNAPPLDQRGYLRSGVPDIGAVEFSNSAMRITSITRLANGHIVLHAIGVPNSQHTFTTYAAVTADSDGAAESTANGAGALQYDDADAVGLTRRFYRLSFP